MGYECGLPSGRRPVQEKALISLRIGAGTAGLAGWAASRIVSSLCGSKAASALADGIVDPIDEWADEMIGASGGLFGEGAYKALGG